MAGTILIVDDNAEEVRHPMQRQLGRVYGPENILEADNGRAALEMVARHRPEVVILDIMMPVMDGIAACQAIRADVDNIGIYIIMLTGRNGGLPEGLAVGADVYLRKPWDFEELSAVVRKGLDEVARFKESLQRQRALKDQVGTLTDIRWAYQDIITSLTTGLILCAPTPAGRIRYMNPAAMRMAGRPPQELRESPLDQLFADADIGRFLDSILANAKPKNVPKTLKTDQEGHTLPVLVSGRVICDTRGQEKWLMLEVRAL
ncbi:MAG: response regulator [Magnetococcales bacterium]|nr:response regulator [Magnetococcales bacterium]